jgi:hypothetical protein
MLVKDRGKVVWLGEYPNAFVAPPADGSVVFASTGVEGSISIGRA